MVIVSAKRQNAPVVPRSVQAIFVPIFLKMAETMTKAAFCFLADYLLSQTTQLPIIRQMDRIDQTAGQPVNGQMAGRDAIPAVERDQPGNQLGLIPLCVFVSLWLFYTKPFGNSVKTTAT